MATTGNDLWLYTQSLIDKDYSDWLSTAKANRIFKTALYNVIEQKLAVMDNQKIYDELSFLIKTNEYVQCNPVGLSAILPNTIHKVPFLISNATLVGSVLTLTSPLKHNLTISDTISWSNLGFLTTNNNGTGAVDNLINNYTIAINITDTTTGTYQGGGSFTTPYQVTDYMRLLTIKSSFIGPRVGTNKVFVANTSANDFFTVVTQGNPTVIQFNTKTKLRTGSKIRIFIDGYDQYQYYVNQTVTQISDKRYSIPYDLVDDWGSQDFYAHYIYEEYCTPYFSDGKINKNNVPKVYEPAFEDRENSIMIYPITDICTGVYIDYVHKPNYFIDVTNAYNDLELVYTNKFLYSVANEFANIFSAATRDPELYRSIENEIIQNP
jgi:hypothetical protein